MPRYDIAALKHRLGDMSIEDNTDAVQLAFKREADPQGLLNPGKMITFEDADFDDGSGRSYLFPALARHTAA